MQLQFNKTVLPCLRQIMQQVQTQEQTQEIRLPDGMPDIGRVLASWGQLLVRGKEWRSSGMSVNGGVMTWILYMPEDEGQPQCVEGWIPFQMKWDFPETERDGAAFVQPLLRFVDARTTSARKLMVRAGISALGDAAVDDEVELYQPEALPEDVRILKKHYPMVLPREAGEKAFLIDEVLTLPASMPQPEKLIRYCVQPTVLEQKVMGDKVVFRGTANLHILYLSADGQLHSWDFEMPYSQYAELRGEYSPEASVNVILAVTSLELDRAEEDNYAWKTGITAQYIVYDTIPVETVQDAYSPKRAVTPQTVELRLPAMLDTGMGMWQPQQTVEFEGITLADTTFYPDHPRLYREGDKVSAELSGTFQVLGYDGAGELTAATARWEDTKDILADPSAKVSVFVQPNGKLEGMVTGEGAALDAELPLTTVTVNGQGVPMVTSLEMGEPMEADPNRPSLILRRAGDDSLWEIAKNCGSSVEAIQKANGLRQEPAPEQMLLVPVE